MHAHVYKCLLENYFLVLACGWHAPDLKASVVKSLANLVIDDHFTYPPNFSFTLTFFHVNTNPPMFSPPNRFWVLIC